MPRNVSDIYFIPPGTEGFPDTTIESAKYNTYIHDVEEDLNRPRPISAGGTGADDADEALANLGAEKASQAVVNYDTHVFFPGSFYSAASATASPVSGHAFVGWAISSDPPANPPTNANVIIHAKDQSDTAVPSALYVREKKSNVWGPWKINAAVTPSPVPPTEPPDNTLYWDNEKGFLYIYYNDGDTKQWVMTSPQPYTAHLAVKDESVQKIGDTMTGVLTLAANPTAALEAATKQYVDANASVVRVKKFTASGTYVPDANLVSCVIECVGGGGAGGGCAGAADFFLSAGGGGSGGYSRKDAIKADVGASQPVTIGAGGAGVLAATGGTGGTTSVGSLCIALGGSGGPAYAFGASGALPGTGDIAAGGAAGTGGVHNSAVNTIVVVGWGSTGGSSIFGGGGVGGQANYNQQAAGGPGLAYGSGGGGGNTFHYISNVQGGAGSAGFVIITEFCTQ